MSDHDKEESNNPLASTIGMFFLILVPLSLVVMLGFVGAAFLQGSGYKAPPPEAVKPEPIAASQPSPDQMALGRTTFATCAACHGMDGKGMQVGPQKMAPSFEGSKLLLGKAEAPLAAVLKGIHRPTTSPYVGQMMALGAGLDDNQIAAVLTYARNSFGNSASAITPEQSAAVRTQYSKIVAPMGLKREDLEKIAVSK